MTPLETPTRTLHSECWRFEPNPDASVMGRKHHVHLALIQSVAVYSVIKIATNDLGRWEVKFSHPFIRQDEHGELVKDDDALRDFDRQRYLLRGDVRRKQDDVSLFKLWGGSPCNLHKVDSSLTHVLRNEGVSLWDINRDGWPAWNWETSPIDWLKNIFMQYVVEEDD